MIALELSEAHIRADVSGIRADVPGGLLPLRIFETRYVDMVGGCMRQSAVFGVVLIVDGNDTSSMVNIAAVGTSARIVDFQEPDLGKQQHAGIETIDPEIRP